MVLFALLLVATALLMFGALVSSARQAAGWVQAVHEGAQFPLVHVEAPAGFVAPIVVVINDATGRSFRVVIDEHGVQHAQPVMSPN